MDAVDSAYRQSVGVAGLIVPYPRHAPCGTVGSPQYKDGTSMAAPDPNNAFWRLLEQAGSRPVTCTVMDLGYEVRKYNMNAPICSY